MPGSRTVFSDDPWEPSHSTTTAGRIVKLGFDGDGSRARAELRGPRDWAADQRRKKTIAELTEQLARTGHDPRLELELDTLQASYREWRRQPQLPLPLGAATRR